MRKPTVGPMLWRLVMSLSLFLGVSVMVISAESQSASTVTSQSFSTSVVSDTIQSSASSADRELAPPKLVLTAADKTLTVGQTVRIQAKRQSAGIVWRSSEPKVATVDAESGQVTAQQAGDVTISGTLTKDQVTTTATTKLTVVPVVKRARQSVVAVDPADFKITTELKNHTYDVGDTATHLKSVVNRDTYQFSGVLTAPELPKETYIASLVVGLDRNADILEVLVDGEAVEYSVLSSYEEPRLKTVMIHNIALPSQARHTFSVVCQAGDFVPWTYQGQTSAYLYEDPESPAGTILGNPYTIDYVEPKLVVEANTVDFGMIKTSAIGMLFDGQSDGALLKVTDTRRNKPALRLYLSQRTQFENENGYLDADLYFETIQGGALALLSNNETLVQESKAGELLQSVTGQPLKFKLRGLSAKPGQYQSELDWTITNAPG